MAFCERKSATRSLDLVWIWFGFGLVELKLKLKNYLFDLIMFGLVKLS